MKISNTVGLINSSVAAHSALTSGVHGAGEEHLALFGQASEVLSKVVWKDVSERALSDLNRTATLDYTDLDLTAFTSANAKFAMLDIQGRVDSVSAGGSCLLIVRKNGTTPSYTPSLRYGAPYGDIYTAGVRTMVIVGLDSGQVIEYTIIITGTIQIDTYINVLGYIE